MLSTNFNKVLILGHYLGMIASLWLNLVDKSTIVREKRINSASESYSQENRSIYAAIFFEASIS